MLSVFMLGPTNAFLPRQEKDLEDTFETVPALGDWDLTLQVKNHPSSFLF
jgi:hypothetical protein